MIEAKVFFSKNFSLDHTLNLTGFGNEVAERSTFPFLEIIYLKIYKPIPIKLNNTENTASTTITRKIDCTTLIVTCLPTTSAPPLLT